jgi:ribonuclease BN (tRNA processing enzyme)
MSEAGITVAELDALLVTHHHRDHNEEFTPITLLAALVGEPLIAGPPGTDRMVQFALDFYEEDLAYRARNRVRPGGPYELTAQDLIGGETIELPGIRIATARVNHSIHTVAYRFDAGDESIVVSGDLTYSPSLSELARGADVLVIDSGTLRLAPGGAAANRPERAHANLTEVATMVRDAGTPCLVLTHLATDFDEATVRAQLARNYSGTVIFARDLMEVTSGCALAN